MKKYLIVMAAAVFALALASCDKKNEGGTEGAYTKIAFKQAEVSIAEGETYKLILTYEPTSLDAPTCEWSSSNPEVATVNKGAVTGVAQGETNITAKLGELTAVCKVTVLDPRATLGWGGIARFSEFTILDPETKYDIALSDGSSIACVLGYAEYLLWDEGVSLDDEGHIVGEGYIVDLVNVPTYVIADGGQYDGQGVGSVFYAVNPENYNPLDTAYAYCVPAGKLGDAAKQAARVAGDTTIKYEECFEGPEVLYLYNENFYYADAVLAGGYFYGTPKTMRFYNFGMIYTNGQTGLVVDEEGVPVTPYQWDYSKFVYEYNTSNAPATRTILPAAKQASIKNRKAYKSIKEIQVMK